MLLKAVSLYDSLSLHCSRTTSVWRPASRVLRHRRTARARRTPRTGLSRFRRCRSPSPSSREPAAHERLEQPHGVRLEQSPEVCRRRLRRQAGQPLLDEIAVAARSGQKNGA